MSTTAIAGVKALWDLPAPAKLNLFLHVVGRRADGYHLLESPFVLIDWADTLHLERRADGRIARHDLGLALPSDDLCTRAARALQQAAGCALGVDISIDKQVPAGAGLGGGSSDAATVLLGLNRLWGLGWPRARLQALALTLGADVPFFVGGRNAYVQGIGEALTPVTVSPQRFAVVKPAASLPTAAIFQSPLLVRDTKPAIVAGFPAEPAAQHATDRWKIGQNDLQRAAEAAEPEVTRALEWLSQHIGPGRMTGSGSAVFAPVFEPGDAGKDTGTGSHLEATWPAALPPGWVGRSCRSLDHHPLERWAD